MRKEVFEKRRVIWIGENPKGNERFRIVDLGPPRPDTRDNQFVIEQGRGQDALGINAWAGISSGSKDAAIYALLNTVGLAMIYRPSTLYHDHPLMCELHTATMEGREPRGCDCGFPQDPDAR